MRHSQTVIENATVTGNSNVCVRRLQVLSSHLSAQRFLSLPNTDPSLDLYRKRGAAFDPALLRKALQGISSEYYDSLLRAAEKIPILTNTLYHDTPRPALRELLVRQIAAYFSAVPLTYDQDAEDSRKLIVFLLCLWAVNQGLSIRLSVHLVLYCDSLRCLGTSKHIPLLKRAWALKDYGSFSMTELGHGSNAGGVETTATYDHAKKEFELNTPHPMAAKWWIGAVGKTANMSIIFARLIVSGKDEGVHAFVVPIRDYATHEPLPGVILGDCGPKEGLQGIDNGFIIFQRYRVPYDTMLDKFSHIKADGKLHTSIKNKDKRFTAMLSAFTRGRTGIIYGSLLSLRNALTIAVRYSAVRKQFGPPGKPEIPILDYPLLRFRLMPHLANLFAASQLADLILVNTEKHKVAITEAPDGMEAGELHALLSLTKTMASWYSQKGIQEVRECLSGHGYSAFSGLGTLLTDNDVNATWEGDNNVLLQQTSRFLFRNIQKMMKGQRFESEYVSFLTLDFSQVQKEKAEFTTIEQLRGNIGLYQRMLTHRTLSLLARSMHKLQENSAKFDSMFDSWNHTQVFHMHSLAIAFAEKLFCDELAKKTAETTAKSTETGAILTKLLELFAVSKIVADLGTFRDGDYVSSEQAIILRDYMVELCQVVAESSVRIIDAIAVPDHLLGSPFGMSNGQLFDAYTRMVEAADGCYDKPTWVGLIKEVRKALPEA